MRVKGFLWAAVLVACLTATTTAESVPSWLVDRMTGATVQVKVGPGLGTGVLVRRGSEVYVWTAAHGTGGAQEVLIVQGENSTTVTLASECETDAVLYKLETAEGFIGHTVFAASPPRPGTEVFHAGYFGGPPVGITRGIVSWLGTDSGQDGTTAPVGPGSSGGGLFDAQGRCIGLARGKPNCALSVIVSARLLKEAAEKASVGWAVPAAKSCSRSLRQRSRPGRRRG